MNCALALNESMSSVAKRIVERRIEGSLDISVVVKLLMSGQVLHRNAVGKNTYQPLLDEAWD
jgi:hypothetical protein